ncbi:MAG: TRAP transporter substrate-binding protein [Betaproteobacteria bacterium]
MHRTHRIAAAFAGCVLATAVSAQTTLKLAHTQSSTDSHHLAAVFFADEVKKRSNGAITVSVHPSGELGNDPATLEGVRLGTIDIGLTGNPFFTRFDKKLNALDLPFLFADYAHAYRVVDGPIGSQLLTGLEQNRMKGLAFWEIGFRHVTNSKRPIVTPKDLQGLKIRTTPNPAHVEAFKLLGANPTPMAFTELYLALETGTVDGQENPVGIIYSQRFNEVQKHLSLTGHAYTVSILAMNLDRFQKLPAAQQKILVDSARDAATYQRKLNRDIEGKALAELKAKGMAVVEKIDTSAFQAIVAQPTADTYIKEFGPDLVNAIRAQQK